MTNESDPLRALAIIQARLGSVRFPGKALVDLGGKPLVEFMIERVRRAHLIGNIVLAVPERDLDSPLSVVASRQKVTLVGGAEKDVLDRFAGVVVARPDPIVVRLTADCPLVDPLVIDQAIDEFVRSKVEYLRTDLTFPDGLDVEVTTRDAIIEAAGNATSLYDREHVTPWIVRNRAYRQATVSSPRDLGRLRLTIDEPKDLEVVRDVLTILGSDNISLATLGMVYQTQPSVFAGNADLVRDQGSKLTDSEKLWRRAKRVIPGGVSLLSKRPDMHLPDRWPTYFTSASGCGVTSLDGNDYLDMGLMGIGTSILGFGDPRVNEAVRKVVGQGVVSTLNCPEEVLLAERLIELHPWSAKARFARSGGEACAMAVRIARAASGRDGIAFCGYHGWHDWYLAANLAEDAALDDHLLPGLSSRGVPRALAGSSVPFNYNDLIGLQEIVKAQDIGVIIMEVERSISPNPGFLDGIRQLASQEGIVLIFDESTSGFRRTLGGHHLWLGVEPDMAIFGKTLGNGFAISAVIGTEQVMDVANELFISSTFWSERIGPAAALATLQAMEQDDAPSRIHGLGRRFRQLLREGVGASAELVEFSGLPALTTLSIRDVKDNSLVKTFISQSLLSRGYLAGTAFYASLAHEKFLIQFTSDLAETLQEVINRGPDGVAESLGQQPKATSGFSRLA